jgi:uncharacterized protein (DUF2384 family)
MLGRLLHRGGVEESLRERLQGFVFQERFAKEVDCAMSQYFGRAASRRRMLMVEEDEIPGLQEWLIYDYVTRSGARFVDLFAQEVGPELPEAEAKLLDAWGAMNRLRLFEVESVRPGVGVVVRDLLSDEVMTIEDRSASRPARRWTVILARPSQAEDRVCFTGSMPVLTPRSKRDMVAAAHTLWEAYHARRPEATLADFYRDHSLDLLRAMERLHVEEGKPPIVLTNEGHRMVMCSADYRVRDPQAVAEALIDGEEFELVGPREGDPSALAFVWVKRGRSYVPEAAERPEKALIMGGQLVGPSGEHAVTTLGDIMLWETRMELQTMSRERMAAGKALLAEVLGRLVLHRRDRTESIASALATMPAERSAQPGRRRLSREEAAMMRTVAEQQTRKWLDTPVPDLNNRSPRQAMKTPDGRAEVIELFKEFEYMDDLQRQRGDTPAIDLALIRRELGLPGA